MGIRLIKGDSFELLKELESESVDALITDPPYNIARENNFKTIGRAGIDFGEWDKNFDLIGWIDSAIKVVKKGGNVVIFTDWKMLTLIVQALTNAKCTIKDMLRIEKTNPMPRNRDRRFIVDYEVAIWAVKNGGKWTFNRQSKTYERPLIPSKVTPKSEKINGGHPTQKSLEVMEWIITRLTNENDTVLDSFAGSGTTAVACQKLNRSCIAIEKDEHYFTMMSERLKILQR